jgi:hypothetical protein
MWEVFSEGRLLVQPTTEIAAGAAAHIGATSDENSVPPWTREDFRRVSSEPSSQPPEGFTTAVVSPSFPHLVRGIFWES